VRWNAWSRRKVGEEGRISVKGGGGVFVGLRVTQQQEERGSIGITGRKKHDKSNIPQI